jgi:thiol-disulfide isomerase/thioredoxin
VQGSGAHSMTARGRRVSFAGLALLTLSACSGQTQQHSLNSSLNFHLGQPAPRVHTKTLADVGGDISRITTYRQPDERMYEYSVDQALASGKPVLLEFATPAHCTPCDRQLQMIKSLVQKYQTRMIFIHMDQYDDPEAYKAYGVPGDPWTFVIDARGIVRFQQAGSMLYGELESAIQSVL